MLLGNYFESFPFRRDRVCESVRALCAFPFLLFRIHVNQPYYPRPPEFLNYNLLPALKTIVEVMRWKIV